MPHHIKILVIKANGLAEGGEFLWSLDQHQHYFELHKIAPSVDSRLFGPIPAEPNSCGSAPDFVGREGFEMMLPPRYPGSL